MLTDLTREALWTYRSDYMAPEDFDSFWEHALGEARSHDLSLVLRPVQTPLRTLDVFDVTFAGRCRAWLRLPRHHEGNLPAVVQFHGYGSGRGSALHELHWASAGYAHLQVEVRGQHGRSGFLTEGIEHRDTFAYRQVFTDAARAVDAVRGLEMVDASRVALVGNSQGGGIALAVAALVPDVAAVHAQAPFLCDLRRVSLVATRPPYTELVTYLAARRAAVEQVLTTLSYFDGVGFACRATAPAWFSAGLMDDVVPPSTVFGAFHAYQGPKWMALWEYSGHEAGGADDLGVVLHGFNEELGRTS